MRKWGAELGIALHRQLHFYTDLGNPRHAAAHVNTRRAAAPTGSHHRTGRTLLMEEGVHDTAAPSCGGTRL